MHPLLKTPKILHLYKEGATFNKVMMLYRFDKKLRLLLFNEIEKIEIAVREAVMNMTAERTGDIYWLTNSAHFRDQSIFVNSMAMLSKEYERSTEDFIEHFKRTYTEPFPPAWILGELLPMGSVNMYYRNLKDKGLKSRSPSVSAFMLQCLSLGFLCLRLLATLVVITLVFGTKSTRLFQMI